jgi:amidase
MNAFYDQIDACNPDLNAMVNVLDRDRALGLARAADTLRANNPDQCGALHGLPVAVKDLVDAEGFPTTFGYVPFKDAVATQDAPTIARMRAAGALIIGKTNVPEFGLGSHTYNWVFGTTRNPYAADRSAGGSSGGAAASLACGMLSVADGSDMGGSLRNPASFCNVVGLRPSIGRVPGAREFGWFGRLSTLGPMARQVDDVSLLLSVQAGWDASDPLSLAGDGSEFLPSIKPSTSRLRLAVSADFNGIPVDHEVQTIITAAAESLAENGCTVEPACPDMNGAMDVFQTQRAASLATLGHRLERTVDNWREYTKESAIWNIEQGYALNADAIIRSEIERTRIYQRVVRFFEDYDALLLPAAQVPPFDAELDWVHEINGEQMPTYLDWMTVCCAISITGLPAISVPAGFTRAGLPVGLQVVGPPQSDLALLNLAHRFEQINNFALRRPSVA